MTWELAVSQLGPWGATAFLAGLAVRWAWGKLSERDEKFLAELAKRDALIAAERDARWEERERRLEDKAQAAADARDLAERFLRATNQSNR